MTKAIRKESGSRLTITTRMTKRKIETLLHLTEIFPASCKAVSRCSTWNVKCPTKCPPQRKNFRCFELRKFSMLWAQKIFDALSSENLSMLWVQKLFSMLWAQTFSCKLRLIDRRVFGEHFSGVENPETRWWDGVTVSVCVCVTRWSIYDGVTVCVTFCLWGGG